MDKVPTKTFYVLIVDDNEIDCQTYERYLSQDTYMNYDFSLADTVADGLDALSARKPDCILLDYNLPDGDGLEFIKEAIEIYENLPIVMLTGQSNEEVIIQALTSGAMDYISKGRLTRENLCRTVNRVIEKGTLLQQLAQREREKDELIKELKEALARVKKLSGLLPICSCCKKVRDDKGYWNQVEVYIRSRAEVEFSHGICPDCFRELYPDLDPPPSSK